MPTRSPGSSLEDLAFSLPVGHVGRALGLALILPACAWHARLKQRHRGARLLRCV